MLPLRWEGTWQEFVKTAVEYAVCIPSDMSKLTHEETAFLKEYGVKTLIDLRGKEVENHKNPLFEEDFCTYYNIPFITMQISDITPMSMFFILIKMLIII